MITKLTYNWHQAGDNDTGFGEDYDIAEVGDNDTKTKLEVESISEHSAQGEGDKWYYIVSFIDGSTMTVFNPNIVHKK